MNNPTPSEFLAGRGACAPGADFALRYPTMADVWAACCASGHIDWCAWILSSDPALAPVARRVACWCVRHTPLADGRTVWDLLTDPRSRRAVEVAERYAAGEASEAELSDAHSAATSAYAVATYDPAFAYAIYHATYASAANAAALSASAATAAYAASAAHACAAASTYASAAHACAAASASTYAAPATDSAKNVARLAQLAQLRKINPFATTTTESIP